MRDYLSQLIKKYLFYAQPKIINIIKISGLKKPTWRFSNCRILWWVFFRAEKGFVCKFSSVVLLPITMEALVCCSLPSLVSVKTRNIVTHNCSLTVRKSCDFWVKNEGTTRRRRTRVGVVSMSDVTTTFIDSAPVDITWQIVVGTIGNTIYHTL